MLNICNRRSFILCADQIDAHFFERRTMANPNSEEQCPDVLNISVLDLLYFRGGIVKVICEMLNPPKVIPTEGRLSRDWRGLAVLLSFSVEEVSYLASDSNSTLCLLKKLTEKERCPVTILLLLLERLDRFDVVDDVTKLLREGVSLASESNELFSTQHFVLSPEDRKALGRGLPPVNYHAFILYASEDVEFACTLVKKMEEEYSPPLKIFIKDRDLVVGAVNYNATIKLIAERCSRMIVVLSPAFVRSPENSFFISFAQSIGINQRRRNIIPCLLSECDIPTELKSLHMIDYKRPTGGLYNFWDKLYKSISTLTIDPTVLPSLSMISEYGDSTLSNRSAMNAPNIPNHNSSSSALSIELPTIPSEHIETISTSVSDLSNKSNKKKSTFLRRIINILPRSTRDYRKKETFAATSRF